MALPILEVIRWKRLYYFSLFAFIISVVLFKLSPVISAIFMFSMLSWWTLLPGRISPYLMEINIGDFFTVMIALYIGPIEGAIFGFLNIWAGPIFGKAERLQLTSRISIVAIVATLLVPTIYNLTGQSVLYTLYGYSISFYTIHLASSLMISRRAFLNVMKFSLIALPMAFITNKAYLSVFGEFSGWIAGSGIGIGSEMILATGGLMLFFSLMNFREFLIQKTGSGSPLLKSEKHI
ncbi:TPA: hypothetical protein H1008_02720 [archaeon]|nr:hypothetical protein [Candidatus Undinarchaeales archaeon SRR5007147.bin71]